MNYRLKHLAGRKRLAWLMEQQKLISVSRNLIPLEDPIMGVICGYSNNLMMIRNFTDFRFDGFKVIQIKDITEYSYDVTDFFAERVLKCEGLMENVCFRNELNLSDWSKFFQSLSENRVYPVIENERTEMFIVGKVVKTMEDGFALAALDGMGSWQQGLMLVPFSEISCVSIDCNYVNLLRKYSDDESHINPCPISSEDEDESEE